MIYVVLLLLWRRRLKTMHFAYTVTTRSWQQRIRTVSVMASDSSKNLRAVSFNMHGFYQGCPVIAEN